MEKCMRAFAKILNIFTWLLVIAAILLAIALVGVRVLGYTPYYIKTASMTPTYQVNDLVYVKKVTLDELQIGDPVTYVKNEQLDVVTHRVVSIDKEGGYVTTKGDANDTEDAPILFGNIVGKVHFSIPKLGIVSKYLSTKNGKYGAVAIGAAILLLLIIPEFFKPAKKKDPKPEKTSDKDQSRD